MVSVLTGLVAGLVATIVMTAFMMALGDDSPPPTAALWARYVGDEGPEAYMMQGMALHVLYGALAGGAFVLLATVAGLGVGPGALATTLGIAVGYGIVLTVVGAAFWMKVVLGLDPEPQTAATFGLFHLIYAVVLAAVVVYLPEFVAVPAVFGL